MQYFFMTSFIVIFMYMRLYIYILYNIIYIQNNIKIIIVIKKSSDIISNSQLKDVLQIYYDLNFSFILHFYGQ